MHLKNKGAGAVKDIDHFGDKAPDTIEGNFLKWQVSKLVDAIFVENRSEGTKKEAYNAINRVLANILAGAHPEFLLQESDITRVGIIKEKLASALGLGEVYPGERDKFDAFLRAVQAPEIGLYNVNPLKRYEGIEGVLTLALTKGGKSSDELKEILRSGGITIVKEDFGEGEMYLSYRNAWEQLLAAVTRDPSLAEAGNLKEVRPSAQIGIKRQEGEGHVRRY